MSFSESDISIESIPWSTSSSRKYATQSKVNFTTGPVFLLSVFTAITLIIAISVVSHSAPKQQVRQCHLRFKETVIQHSILSNSLPRSGAARDFNNDGLLDIVVANSGTDNVGVFLGAENGTFQVQKTYFVGPETQPYSVVVGDFNNDDLLDIITVNYGANSIGILLGYGNGTFTSASLYSLGSSRPIAASTAHFNDDIFLDVVLVNYGTSTIQILLGHGNASFSVQWEYSTGYDSFPYGVAVADLNNDTRMDLVISNSGTNNLIIFLGNGDGSFSYAELYSTGIYSRPTAVAIGDLNGDNRLDIIVANYGTSAVSTFLGNGDGTFGKIEISPIGLECRTYSMAIGDFNHDNLLDVAIANSEANFIIILRGFGNGTFMRDEKHANDSGIIPVFVIAADFNSDNHFDIATINYFTNNIVVFSRYLSKTFESEKKFPTGYLSYPLALAVGDFDNDEVIDVVVTNSGINNIYILFEYKNGSFAAEMSISTGFSSVPQSIAVGDLNNDGLLDIAVGNVGYSSLGIFLGYGNRSFSEQMMFSIGNGSLPSSIAVGDLNSDHLPDIIVSNSAGNSISIFHGFGNGTFAEEMVFSTGNNSSPSSVAVVDLNNDTLLDIVVANAAADNVGIFLGFGDGSFMEQQIFSTEIGSYPQSIAVADLNNDSVQDIIVANTVMNNVGILIGLGNANFKKISTYSTGYGSNPKSLALGDFNNDYLIDIAVANSGANNIGILFGYGNGTFRDLQIYSTGDGSDPVSIAAGNFNRDRWLDIVTVNYESDEVGVLLGSEVVYVANHATYSTGSLPYPSAMVASDFNNDELVDLMVVNSAHNNINIYLGYGNGTFSNKTTYSTGIYSRPNFATVGDFNNDHKVDIAITDNLTNSITVLFGFGNGTFRNSEVYNIEQAVDPSFIAAGDLNHDNRQDLILLNQDRSTIGVFQSFNYAKFRLENLYSTGILSYPKWVTVGDLNNDNKLDIAIANKDAGNIGLLFGYGNGTFSQQKTYATGVGTGPYSISFGDFNNDSCLDMAITNSNANNIGIFLGYGNGTFSEQKTFSTGRSSLPRASAVADFNRDGFLDIAVVNVASSNLGIFLGYGDGAFAKQKTFSTGNSTAPRSIAIGDLNNDSLLDVAIGNQDTGTVSIFLGYGNGTFAKQKSLLIGNKSRPHAIAVGYFNSDDALDIVVASRDTSELDILLGYGDGNFSEKMTYSTGNDAFPLTVEVGDLNHDNKADIIVANSGAQNVGIFFGYGDGNFTQQMILETGGGSQPNAVTVGNFNDDNLLDIALTNSQNSDVLVFLRDGNEPFLSMTEYSTGNNSYPQSMAVADINNDSHLDVIVANSNMDNVGILLGKGDGNFFEKQTYSTGNGSQPLSLAIGDFNNDNLLDIVVANSGSNSVGTLLGYGNGSFSTIMTHFAVDSSVPSWVTVGDLNNDKNLDIVVLNSGSRSVVILYGDGNRAFPDSQSHVLNYGAVPQALAVADFDRNNWTDIVILDDGSDYVHIILKKCVAS